ncbi:MAG: hypothetical protein U1C33_03860, partial [Candidatus Cloacimonadaceae bacterium]|nr:hypothetical protein [Candidatus Cloacimonadaceae bacterium]
MKQHIFVLAFLIICANFLYAVDLPGDRNAWYGLMYDKQTPDTLYMGLIISIPHSTPPGRVA